MSNLILLTGAGFTKNFGGFLGLEMWSQIFNHPSISNHLKLKDFLRRQFDYEQVYYEVLEEHPDQYSVEEQRALIKAVVAAYTRLDDSIIGNRSMFINSIGSLKREFLSKFNNVFTLNQDLFLERYGGYHSLASPKLNIHTSGSSMALLSQANFVQLDQKVPIDEAEKAAAAQAGVRYVKLHGSYGWQTSRGVNQMVIGRNKDEKIIDEPLLNSYWAYFRRVLNEQGKKLVIIGYGFRDPHVNTELSNAVKKSGLKIYIINPRSPLDFMGDLALLPDSEPTVIWNHLEAYFPYSLSSLFPGTTTSPSFQEIREALDF